MNYCCEEMKERIELNCDGHISKFDCPDFVIMYIPEFDEYSIVIHDGGKSGILIRYCPWCGKELPMPKRDLWFEILEKLGFDDPFEQDIPVEFLNETWYITEKYSNLIREVEESNIKE